MYQSSDSYAWNIYVMVLSQSYAGRMAATVSICLVLHIPATFRLMFYVSTLLSPSVFFTKDQFILILLFYFNSFLFLFQLSECVTYVTRLPSPDSCILSWSSSVYTRLPSLSPCVLAQHRIYCTSGIWTVYASGYISGSSDDIYYFRDLPCCCDSFC